MKTVVRLPMKQFDEMEMRVRFPAYTDQGKGIIGNGYDCLEGPRFIFIYLLKPLHPSDVEHWEKTFWGMVVVDGVIRRRRDKWFLWIELQFNG